MELPSKSFKITTKKKENPAPKTGSPHFLFPIKSKTPMKVVKTQSKSQTPNKNIRKIMSVKPKFNLISHENADLPFLIKGKQLDSQLPRISKEPMVELTNRVKTETIEEDKSGITKGEHKIPHIKYDQNHKKMIDFYFRNKIRSLFYLITRKELSQNTIFELNRVISALMTQQKTVRKNNTINFHSDFQKKRRTINEKYWTQSRVD